MTFPCPQVPESRFKNQEKLEAWVDGKVCVCAHADHPPREHENYWLKELWFVHEKGTLFSQKAKVTEEMERTTKDLPAGMAVLRLEAGGQAAKKAKLSMSEVHKSQMNKIKTMSNRLGKAIGVAESALPSLRRSTTSSDFSSFRSGLGLCREFRENMLDSMEDLKHLAGTEEEQENQVQSLKDLLKEAGEHLDALTEKKKALEPEPPATAIKSEAEQLAESQLEGSGSENDGTESQK